MSQKPEDLLLVQMQGVIAEYERAKILERDPPRTSAQGQKQGIYVWEHRTSPHQRRVTVSVLS